MNNDKAIISKENAKSIISGYRDFINSKITAKDLAAPYSDKFELGDKLKVDGNANLFLFDNGEYIELDLETLGLTKENVDTIYKLFNITTQEEMWETKANMFTARQALTSCIYKDKIYAIGGKSFGTNSAKNECYDISTDTWSTKANMLTASHYSTSCIYEGKIYVIDGYGTNRTECYDIATDTWSSKAKSTFCVFAASSCVYEGKIYVICGSYSGGPLTRNACYDIATDTWSEKAKPLTPRSAFTSCIYKDKIYCIGGFGGGSTVWDRNECYDISTDTWSSKAKMLSPRWKLTSCIYKDKIYAMSAPDTNECYDIATDTWSSKMKLSAPRFYATSNIYKDKIYIIGGCNSNNADISSNECYTVEHLLYDLQLPDDMQSRLDIINQDGDGTKFLNNKGKYIDITPTLNIITDEDIEEILAE